MQRPLVARLALGKARGSDPQKERVSQSVVVVVREVAARAVASLKEATSARKPLRKVPRAPGILTSLADDPEVEVVAAKGQASPRVKAPRVPVKAKEPGRKEKEKVKVRAKAKASRAPAVGIP